MSRLIADELLIKTCTICNEIPSFTVMNYPVNIHRAVLFRVLRDFLRGKQQLYRVEKLPLGRQWMKLSSNRDNHFVTFPFCH